MDSFSLRENLPFLLKNLSDEEKNDFLIALQPLTLDKSGNTHPALGPTYTSQDDFLEEFYKNLDWTNAAKYYAGSFDKAIANVKAFFTDVTSYREMGSDVLYFLKTGAEVLVNYDETSNLSSYCLFDAVQYSYETGEGKNLKTWTEGLVNIQTFNLDMDNVPSLWLDCLSGDDLVDVMILLKTTKNNVAPANFTSNDITEMVNRLAPVSRKGELGNIVTCFYKMQQDKKISADDFMTIFNDFDTLSYTAQNRKGQNIEKTYTLTASDIGEAMQWYYSNDLAWMDEVDRMDVITQSFHPSVVKEKKKKWESYANQPEFSDHRYYAQKHLNEGYPKTRFENFFGNTEYDEKTVLDAMSIIITVESKGDEKAPTNTSSDKCRNFYGLMQVCGDHFSDERYKSDNFTGDNFQDPQANIETGVNYLVKYCMRESVNPDKSFSRALALYNGLTSETPNYLRDYIIYHRFLGSEIV